MAIQSSQNSPSNTVPISDPRNTPRSPGQGTHDSVDYGANLPSCSIHSNVVATVQCKECRDKKLPVKPSYNCSNKCYQDAWKDHKLYHRIFKVGSIKVLSYSIMSDIYVNVDRYVYCPKWALIWVDRVNSLIRELAGYNADILCLQEVLSDHFENLFKPELEKAGYSVAVAYKKTTRPVYTSIGPSGNTADGCATFYRRDKFKEVISYEHEFSNSASLLIDKLEPSLRDHAGRPVIKDSVALVVLLEVLGGLAETPASRLYVVNTHIYANKDSTDVKLLQVSELVNEIGKTIDPKMPLFICGDMNSFAGSDPRVQLTKHKVNIAPAQAPDRLCIFQHLELQHSMKLASAYASLFFNHGDDIKGLRMKMKHSESGEPLFTSLPPSVTNLSPCGSALDYIFYKVDSVEIEDLLDPPGFESVGRSPPSPSNRSNHVALMGTFRITRPFLG